MSKYKSFLPALLAVLVLLIYASPFVVHEWQTAI
jgi:flagellar biosynthesis protein FliQ